MKLKINFAVLLLAEITLFVISCNQQSKNETAKTETVPETDPLPSWNEAASKKSIIDFVTKTTKESSADLIPVADRIACLDNDGTL